MQDDNVLFLLNELKETIEFMTKIEDLEERLLVKLDDLYEKRNLLMDKHDLLLKKISVYLGEDIDE